MFHADWTSGTLARLVNCSDGSVIRVVFVPLRIVQQAAPRDALVSPFVFVAHATHRILPKTIVSHNIYVYI